MDELKAIACIPCYNTEQLVGAVVSECQKYVDEVIVIDDGSRDKTAEAARKAGALVVSHMKNLGYGAAVQSCFALARKRSADLMVTLDGDGQHNAAEIPQILAPILRGEADLVIGSRFLANMGDMPSYRRFGIKVITALFNFGSKTRVSDAQSGLRAYNSKLLRDLSLSESGMSISIEILEKARKSGAKIREVPISCRYLGSTFCLEADIPMIT